MQAYCVYHLGHDLAAQICLHDHVSLLAHGDGMQAAYGYNEIQPYFASAPFVVRLGSAPCWAAW